MRAEMLDCARCRDWDCELPRELDIAFEDRLLERCVSSCACSRAASAREDACSRAEPCHR